MQSNKQVKYGTHLKRHIFIKKLFWCANQFTNVLCLLLQDPAHCWVPVHFIMCPTFTQICLAIRYSFYLLKLWVLLPDAPKVQPPPHGCWGQPGAARCNRRPSSRLRSKASAVWRAAHAWHCKGEQTKTWALSWSQGFD